MQDYVRVSRYASFNEAEKRRHTWEEQVNLVHEMHKTRFAKEIGQNKHLAGMLNVAMNAVKNKEVLGSQRALQFTKKCLDKNCRIYNCAATPIDRPEVFGEIEWALLCGTGVGISVQSHHIAKLPNIGERDKGSKIFVIPDTIEGWSDAISVLMYSYFRDILGNSKRALYQATGKKPVQNMNFEEYSGYRIMFDLKNIRPKGAPISGITGKAPGPEPLEQSLKKIESVIERRIQQAKAEHAKAVETGIFVSRFPQIKLRPIDVFDIIMHTSDAVLSAGVRRSAILTMFSFSDKEMMNAKTGNWYIENPQRARSNNSVVLIRNKISKPEFESIIESTQQFGEPGFIWSDDEEYLFNPCVEVGLYAYDEKGRSGFQFCNLTEINMGSVKTPEEFYARCETASILGTFQAGYTDFDYLGPVTEAIVRREALLGVSMTGMCDVPSIALNPEYLRKGAGIVVSTNEQVAEMLGINPAARTTCVKPAGSTTLLLGLNGSGIHPAHAKRYIRRIQVNSTELPGQIYAQENPAAVSKSSWSSTGTDNIISFLATTPEGAITKADLTVTQMLENVKLVQQHWVIPGTNKKNNVKPGLTHNVSNTVTIRPDEWKTATDFIYKHRQFFAGISMIGDSGDKDYIDAPLQEVLTSEELVKKYGNGALYVSGLLVHAEEEFGNIYAASNALLGISKVEAPEEIKSKLEKHYSGGRVKRTAAALGAKRAPVERIPKIADFENAAKQQAWLLRAKKFASNYFNGDCKTMIYCMKDVDANKKWTDIEKSHVPIDWSLLRESEDQTGFMGDVACSGDKCSRIL